MLLLGHCPLLYLLLNLCRSLDDVAGSFELFPCIAQNWEASVPELTAEPRWIAMLKLLWSLLSLLAEPASFSFDEPKLYRRHDLTDDS